MNKPHGHPPVSLIIASRNRPDLLWATVASVLQGDERPAEIIVVDQSDTPHGPPATLSSNSTCEVHYLWTESVGSSRSRNAGIAAAKYDLLALIDDDMFVAPTWFGSLIQALIDAQPRAVVTGRVLPAEPELPGGFAPSTKLDEAPVVYVGRVGGDILYTGNMAMFRSAVDEVGTFDTRLGPGTRFPAAEDNDFGFRLLEAGHSIIYAPEAVVYHRAARGERDYLRLRWNYGRGQGGFYAKHLSLRDRFMLGRMSRDLLRRVYRAARRAWRQPRRAYGDAIYILGVLAGAGQWILTQRRS